MMKRVFSAWGSVGDRLPHTLVYGEGPPRFVNGEVIRECEVCLWRIEVGTFEEASAIFNLRRGFEPYLPQGDAQPCPNCGVPFYPAGSGQCWNCEHVE